MADEVDRAQQCLDESLEEGIRRIRHQRQAEMKQLAECDHCGEPTFVTDKGTVARFCRECWEREKEMRDAKPPDDLADYGKDL